ncbi:conserved hypothetical protein [Pediculus humanus corporis]|uniref:C2H2-type domain-containing protein n=1 Tax=Pediculus humanus subsp. corporis TaxID=121224 RepID=E0W260_PEDHC|nr:uncharacterized protein Phum_PHUM584720 [Pediculus humanus corporis]EEB19716.1 conserved hypothetical protein [Pediculus humanus corporis]
MSSSISENIKEEKLKSTNQPALIWVCEICGKTFKHRDSRRQHYKSHEGSTECPICHNVLSRKYELKVHMRKRHNIIKF